jgi:hypothetical protein
MDHERGVDALECASFEECDLPRSHVTVRRFRQAQELLTRCPDH